MSHSYKINGRKVSQSVWNDCVQVLQKVDLQKAQKITEDNKVTDEEMNFILDRNGDGKVLHNDFKDLSGSLFGEVKSVLKKHSFSGFNLWKGSHLSYEKSEEVPDQFWSDKEFVLFLAENKPEYALSYVDRYKKKLFGKQLIEKAAVNLSKNDPALILLWANQEVGILSKDIINSLVKAVQKKGQSYVLLLVAKLIKNEPYGKKLIEKTARMMAEKYPWVVLQSIENYKDMPNANKVMEKAAINTLRKAPWAVFKAAKHIKDMPCASWVFEKAGEKDPKFALEYSHLYKDMPYAEKVIEKAARKDPGSAIEHIFKIERVIQKSNNSVSKAILKVHKSIYSKEEKKKVAALLNETIAGRMTFDEAVKISRDDRKYFDILFSIKVKPNHIASVSVDRALKNTSLRIIRRINDLHNVHSSVRFKSVQNLGPGGLYTLMVYAEEEIFTSSFNGLFDRLLKVMKRDKLSGDKLLDMVGHNKFRTFIKLCAGFNRLGEFIKTMDGESRRKLLVKFVSNVDKEKKSLSEAVTVADTFSMIKNNEILKVLQKSIKENYERVCKKADKEAKILYGLLAGMFGKKAVINETWIKEMSRKYKLADLTSLDSKELFNPGSVNIQQHFFYNDNDGVSSFNSFLRHYRGSKGWRIDDRGNYVFIKSNSSNGKGIEIYANKPTESGEDQGTKQIARLLLGKGNKSTVIVHRGHSYHVDKTIWKISPDTRIVSLGSCGGYNNIAEVLKRAPKAHIISTKGVGTMSINDPLFKMLNEEILGGRNINWIKFWERAGQRFSKSEDFENYIAPHRNLGVLFLKAYHKLVNRDSKSLLVSSS